MIVLSAGMERAGTRWYYNLTNDLLIAAGHQDAREVRERYGLHSILRTPDPYLPRMHSWQLRQLDRISQLGCTFAVKTHRQPSLTLRRLMARGRFKVTYIYRDLRDVIVSRLERARQMRDRGKSRRRSGVGSLLSFGRFYTVKGAARWVRWRLIPVWEAYGRCDGVLITRYEDLLADSVGQLKRLADHLELDVSAEQIEKVVATYQQDEAIQGPFEKLPFLNRGIVGRYKHALNPEEQELCRDRFGKYLQEMGYEVSLDLHQSDDLNRSFGQGHAYR